MITFFLPLKGAELIFALVETVTPKGILLYAFLPRLTHSHSLWTTNYEVLVWTHRWLSGA